MKRKILTLSLNLLVVFALICGLLAPVLFADKAVNVAYAADYYSSVTATSGKALLGQLHDLIVTTHTKYTSYDDCKTPSTVMKTDGGSKSGTVMEFYTQADMSSKWGGGDNGTWNREHVWCQSLSNNLWGTSGGGSDMHHIRPSEAKLNGIRGNKKYGETSNGTPQYAVGIPNIVGGYTSGDIFEPVDSVKGDVARIVMYVYTHYNSASNVGGTKESTEKHGNLPITNIISAGGEAQSWALLLRWNKLDPVDNIERTRNEAVYGIQHNRNPFIDNESYADAIWGNGTVEKVDLQSLSLSPNTLSLTIGTTQTLSVQATPSNANASVTWSSSDTSVATVNNGVVTAVANGSATITATSVENSSIKAVATVTVKKASSIELSGSPTKTEYQAGQSFDPSGLTVKVVYDDGTSASFSDANGLRQFTWTDASTGQTLLTEATTQIKCKYGNLEQIGAWTVTVTPAPEHISGFISSVSALSDATTLKLRFDAIKAVLQIYNKMSQEEKNDASVVNAYQTLQQAITAYNADASELNATMEEATKTGAYAICGVTLASIAFVALLQRKFN